MVLALRTDFACALAFAALVPTFGCAIGEPLDRYEPEDSWQVGKGDSPAEEGPLRIVELLASSAKGGDQGRFVEVMNTSDQEVVLDGWQLKVGNRVVDLASLPDRSTVKPGALALVVDDGYDLDAAQVPAWVAVVVPSRPLFDLFGSSLRPILRDPEGEPSDRFDGSKVEVSPGISLERTADGGVVASTLGSSPGQRNAEHDADAIRTYFTKPPYDVTDPVAPELVKIIDAAQSTLDGAFFQVNHPDIIDAFIRAKDERGVEVRMVTDTDYFDHKDYKDGYQRMVQAGIPVVPDARSAFMHTKFLVVDGEAVWTGSYNLLEEDYAYLHRADNAVFIRSRRLAEIHAAEFEGLFGGQFGPKPDIPEHEVFVDGAKIDVYFSPIEMPRGSTEDRPTKRAILNTLRGAKDGIYFLYFAFEQEAVGKVMIEQFKAGVDIRGMVNDSATGAKSEYARLAKEGIDVRASTDLLKDARGKAKNLYLHDKYMVIDHGAADPTVITGSYNASDNADGVNEEALYFIHDRWVAADYYRTYRKLFTLATGPNHDATGQPVIVVTEVLSAPAARAPAELAPFVEIQNVGNDPVDLSELRIGDRDGRAVEVTPLLDGADTSLAPGARIAIHVADAFELSPSDPIVIYDSHGRLVSVFDQPAWAGSGMSLARLEVERPDWDAEFVPSRPTPGE